MNAGAGKSASFAVLDAPPSRTSGSRAADERAKLSYLPQA